MLSEIISTVIALVLSALSLFFPEMPITYHIIWLLTIALFFLLYICIRLYIKLASTRRLLSETKEKHSALASRFDEKRNDLAKHKAALESIEYATIVATQSTNRDKLRILYNQILTIKSSINDGGLKK